jgi:hypothetical protein
MGLLQSIYLWWKDRQFHHLQQRTPEEIFTEVYSKNAWGGKKGTFCSGSGTTSPNTSIYIDKIRNFIQQNNIRSIFEIGCGDFRIMNQVLYDLKGKYVGADVVPELIQHNNKKFGNDFISFKKIDAVAEELPPADLIIIRQVLQHLNNARISKILTKTTAFKYALITEHLPITKNVAHNLDKITGPHIRMRINSGVFPDKPPFSMKATVLFEYREDDPVKGKMVPAVMRTYLIRN